MEEPDWKPQWSKLLKVKEDKRRKNCEYNWAELVTCSILLYPCINDKNDILKKINDIKTDGRLNISGGVSNIEHYLIDLKKRKDKQIKDYICNFNDSIKNFDINFTKMYLTGKSFKEYPELITLNSDKGTGKIYDVKITKSDIYLLYSNSNKFVGISVKDSKGATLTNYSIEKVFNELEINHDLKENRIKILKDNFGENNYKYTKSQRDEANKLFYGKDNEYFQNIINIMETNEKIITKKLLSIIFPKLNYDVYGFNGIKLTNLNKLCEKINKKTNYIKRETKYETNKSAKLWYSLYLDGIESWKFCIRGKTEIYRGSFQILEFTKI